MDSKELNIEINGVAKVLQHVDSIKDSLSKVQKALENIGAKNINTDAVAKYQKQLQKLEDSVKEVRESSKREFEKMQADYAKSLQDMQKTTQKELSDIKNNFEKTGKDVEEIGGNIKFANFRKAVKSISTELVNIGTAALTSGKSATETINDVGSSIAGIASNFGIFGAAAGAAITIITPMIASFFELSESQKAVKAATDSATKSFAEEVGSLNANIATVLDSTASYEALKLAKDDLIKQYPQYFENLDIEKLSKEQLLSFEKQITAQLEEQALAKAKQAAKAETYAKILEAEIKRKQLLATQDRDDLLRLGKIATGGITGIGTAAQATELEKVNKNLSDLKQTLLDIDQINIDFAENIKNSEKLASAAFGATKTFKKPEDNKPSTPSTPKEKIELLANTIPSFLNSLDESINENLLTIADYNTVITQTFDELVDSYLTANNAASQGVKTLLEDQDKLNKQLATTTQLIVEKDIELNKLKNSTNSLTKADKESIKTSEVQISKLETAKEKAENSLKILESSLSTNLPKSVFEARRKDILKLQSDVELLNGLIGDEQANIEKITKKTSVNTAEIVKKQKELNTLKEEEVKIRKTITENEIKVSGLSTDKDRAIKNVQNFRKEFIKLGSELEKRTKDNLDKLVKLELQTLDEVQKANLANGFKNYQDFVNNLKTTSDKTVSDILKRSEELIATTPSLKEFIKLDGDEIVFDALAAYAKLDPAIVDATVGTVNNLNNLVKLNRQKLNEDLLRSQDDFKKQYLPKFIQLNSEEIELFRKNAKLKISENNFNADEVFKQLQIQVAKRRKLNQTQDAEELATIKSVSDARLELVKERQEVELLEQTEAERIALNAAIASGADFTKEEEALNIKIFEIRRKFNKELQQLASETENLIDSPEDVNKKAEALKQTYLKIVADIVSQTTQLSGLLVDLINQNSQNLIDSLQEDLTIIENKTADVLNNINALEEDLEGKRGGRRDAVLQSIEQQRLLEQELAQQRLELAEKIEKEERKIRKRQQAFQISQAIINGALAVTQILAQPSIIPEPLNSIYKGVQIGLSAGTTAAQVALIASQKFAKGGYTGDGIGYKDETGHSVAGVVHSGEWVAPNWLVEDPAYAPIINDLESVRTRGFANGGFTSTNTVASISSSLDTSGQTTSILKSLENYYSVALALSERPIVANPVEFSNVNQKINKRITTNRF